MMKKDFGLLALGVARWAPQAQCPKPKAQCPPFIILHSAFSVQRHIITGMESSSRWIAIAAILGLCSAYALKGGPPATRDLPPVMPKARTSPTAPPPAPVARSALKLNPDSVDFGEVLVGQTLDKEVAVENPTDKPIAVTSVRVNCGCVKAELPPGKILPGQSGVLKVKFIGIAGKRPATYAVTLNTEEPEKAQAALPVAGRTKQVFSVEPPTLVFGSVPKDHSKTLRATIKQAEGKPFQIRTISARHEEFSFKWEPLPEGGYQILATVQGLKIGPQILEQQVAIITDHPVVPAVFITIAARVTREVVSRTPLLIARLGPDGRPGPFETFIERLTPGELVIEKVTEGENAGMEYRVERQADGSLKLTLRITEVFDRTLMGGEFLVQTNVEKQPLSVPFKVLRGAPRMQSVPGKKPVQP